MRKLLLTGFEPFGGEKVNPSWEIARSLDGAEIGDVKVAAARLPVVWGRANEALIELIVRESPDLIVSLGQSGREDICVERVGINVSDAAAADNAGTLLTDAPIDSDGPVAYWSTLPIKAMAAAIRAAGVPAHVSNSAGTYLCNHVMYGALHQLAKAGRCIPCGLIHVPGLPEQAALKNRPEASMGLETQIRGIRAALEACGTVSK
ncbi:MAG: pyroglutamyl-peptidase I [Bacillota bacterium]|nr:pyroglutamyl-peptidase I [Bacillota bacterium]